ncbi:hypothetical protein PCASD_18687 [Puccinia coronata f. sp. avenae]|uniref:Uncharacterized protein n=1 Tax=Puccinia coronata f. sp. avenae TaxID=200324 RepID=A0A2N5U0S6_9BASI|nr:hypothetical protein PCASD_18687 [Puccinia coronata f. sp. avenae]
MGRSKKKTVNRDSSYSFSTPTFQAFTLLTNTQLTMQFNVLAALMLVVAASAVLEANALPIANILPVKPVLSKLYVASAANATIGRPGVPTSQKQMAKAVGW